MAIIKIRPSVQALCDQIALDSVDMESEGIQVQPSTPYAANVYPIADLETAIDNNPDLPDQLLDGTKGYFATLIRRIGPIFAQQYALFASATTFGGSATSLVSYTFPEVFEVARQVEISVNGSCFCTVSIGTRMDFWVEVDGVATQKFRHYFSELSSPKSFSGSWIVTLPLTAAVVVVKGQVVSGSGTINFDGNCFCNVTIKG